MHWLSNRIEGANRLSERFLQSRLGGQSVASTEARHAFLNGLGALAVDVVAREGVTACVVAHDGLVLARAGRPVDDEAIAAAGQRCLAAAVSAGVPLSLGPVRQVVLIGDENKLALFMVGPMAVAVLAPADVSLAQVLA